MRTKITARFGAVAVVAAAAVVPLTSAGAYELRLDIDVDGDPATINTTSELDSVGVRLVLLPTQPQELIDLVEFRLGRDCVYYGTSRHGVWVYVPFDDWCEHPSLYGWWGCDLLDACYGDWDSHCTYFTELVGEPFVLDGPMFIATFGVRVADNPPGCPPLKPVLAVMNNHEPPPESIWNIITIGLGSVPAETTSWSGVKAVFR